MHSIPDHCPDLLLNGIIHFSYKNYQFPLEKDKNQIKMNKVWYQSIAYNVGFQVKKDYTEWMDIMKVIAKSKRGANLGHTVRLIGN